MIIFLLITSQSFSQPIFQPSLDWSNNSFKSYLTIPRNTLIPQFCKGSWASIAAQTVSDRFKVLFNATIPDIVISPQVLLSCATDSDGCSGGDFMSAFTYIFYHGITDESCEAYTSKGLDEGFTCGSSFPCYTCYSPSQCETPKSFFKYYLRSFSLISGESDMISALQSGPIACGISANSEFVSYSGGILIGNNSGNVSINHDVEVIGYGENNGTLYWKARNVWGTYWGIGGYFYIQRGTNAFGIEQYCGVPHPDPNIVKVQHPFSTSSRHRPDRIEKLFFNNGGKTKTYTLAELPKNLDWRAVNGTNFLTFIRNQNSPKYCGSSWAHATTSSIADRFNILHNGSFPVLSLSPQVLINCNAGGSCSGGNPGPVYEFAYTNGLTDDTCQQYIAQTPANPICSSVQVCQTCVGPVGSQNCSAVNGKKYYVKEYGYLAGAEKMKTEIFLNGPISCGLQATQEFEKYTGGIFSENLRFPRINHEVAVVGWGVEGNTEYWIGRNSWGTFWGESGYFRITMHKNNLGIESDCSWGVPDLSR